MYLVCNLCFLVVCDRRIIWRGEEREGKSKKVYSIECKRMGGVSQKPEGKYESQKEPRRYK